MLSSVGQQPAGGKRRARRRCRASPGVVAVAFGVAAGAAIGRRCSRARAPARRRRRPVDRRRARRACRRRRATTARAAPCSRRPARTGPRYRVVAAVGVRRGRRARVKPSAAQRVDRGRARDRRGRCRSAPRRARSTVRHPAARPLRAGRARAAQAGEDRLPPSRRRARARPGRRRTGGCVGSVSVSTRPAAVERVRERTQRRELSFGSRCRFASSVSSEVGRLPRRARPRCAASAARACAGSTAGA